MTIEHTGDIGYINIDKVYIHVNRESGMSSIYGHDTNSRQEVNFYKLYNKNNVIVAIENPIDQLQVSEILSGNNFINVSNRAGLLEVYKKIQHANTRYKETYESIKSRNVIGPVVYNSTFDLYYPNPRIEINNVLLIKDLNGEKVVCYWEGAHEHPLYKLDIVNNEIILTNYKVGTYKNNNVSYDDVFETMIYTIEEVSDMRELENTIISSRSLV